MVPCGKSMRQNEVKTADEEEAVEEEVQGPLCRQSIEEERKGEKRRGQLEDSQAQWHRPIILVTGKAAAGGT